MARLTDTRTAPPGAWRYVQPESGCEIIGSSLPELVQRVAQHRAYRGIEPKDVEAIIVDVERQLCSGLERRFCRAEIGETYEPIVDDPGGLTVSKVTAGTIAFVSFVKTGGKLVDKTESARRAAICRGCRYNRNADGCGACNALYSLIEAAIPADRREQGLKACSVCGCALKAKVLMPSEVNQAADKFRHVTYPAHCWAKPN